MKVIYNVLVASLMVASTGALAVDKTQELSFELEASIPTERHYVKYANPAFGTAKQEMEWNEDLNILNNISTDLQARNTQGGISAYLQSAAVLEHETTAASNIPLSVSIGGNVLGVGSAAAIEMLDAAEARDEKTLALVVSPAGTPAYDGGEYSGTVTMMFDHEIP